MASLFERIAWAGLAAGLIVCATFPAPAQPRPLGDFGRPAPSTWHDDVLPGIGAGRARIFGEARSDLIASDAEREMADRVWRYLFAPHADDWFHDTAAELRRTRVVAMTRGRFDERRYFAWLKRTRYASSSTRYRTVADHVRADADLMASVFLSICAVIELDRQRSVAVSAVATGDRRLLAGVAERDAENRLWIGWFVTALSYRHASYLYALDHLLVESPDPAARELDLRLAELDYWVAEAQGGRFCMAPDYYYAGHGPDAALPSRVLMGGQKPEGEFRK
jgi:hypothetical protein